MAFEPLYRTGLTAGGPSSALAETVAAFRDVGVEVHFILSPNGRNVDSLANWIGRVREWSERTGQPVGAHVNSEPNDGS
ncbi:hypothetical protein BRC82_06770 [Halobacteriales archaeon QS_1_67_19]|nr:MAG: hypothetical protein BRC82_06770 [Halobacteriales archaeon QS_1_67_19]